MRTEQRGHRYAGGTLGSSPLFGQERVRHADPVTWVVVIATVASAAYGAYATYQQGQAQAKAYEYNAQIAETQAAAAQAAGTQEAELARTAAAFEADRQREQDRRTIARARALYGASAIDVNEGSALLVEMDNIRQAESNEQAIRYSGEVRAFEALSSGAARSQQLMAQAGLDRFMAPLASRAGTIGAGAALLSGFGQAARIYSGMRVPARTTDQQLGALGNY